MLFEKVVPGALIFAMFGCISQFVIAEEKSTSPFEFNGYMDIYYQNSPQAHAPVAPATGPSYLEGRVFDNQHNVITLNMVEVSARRKVGEVSFRIDLAFGQMVDGLAGSGTLSNGQPATANSTEPTRNVTQATIGYSPSQIPNLTVTVGKFYSMIGYETTKAKDNLQYSRSLSFNYAIPYWHEGASVSYGVVPDKFNATVQLLNSWDGRISAENNMSPTLALGLNTTPVSGLAANYNFMTGKESSDPGATRQLHELNLTYAIVPEVSVAADYVLALQKHAIATDGSSAEWKTLAIYVKYTPVRWYTLSPRYEIFDDSDKGFALSGFSGAGGIQQKITSITVANNFTISEGLEGRLEYRSDKSNRDGYYKDSNGNSTDQQDSYTVAFLASF